MKIKYIILAFLMFVISGITVTHKDNVRKHDSNTVVISAPAQTGIVLASIFVNDTMHITSTDSMIIDSYPCGILTDTSEMLSNNNSMTISILKSSFPYTAITYYDSYLYALYNGSILYQSPMFIVENIHSKTVVLNVEVDKQMYFNIYLYQLTNKLGWT